MADARPIGVFDSGVGGLTVLHECLVTMPHEDFVYLGDHARLPYGPRSRDEVRRFAHEIGAYLERQGVKMVVVACNTATSVALPDLQEQLTVPVVSVIVPEAHAAVQATRNRQHRPARDRADRRARAATSRSCTRSTPARTSPPSRARSSCR